jgi:HK97 family phage major capsid protein
LRARGANPTALFLSPANWAGLSAEKDAGGYYLLQPSLIDPVTPRIDGVAVYMSPAMPNAIAVACDMEQLAFGWRAQVRISFDMGGNYFAADQTAVRAIARFDMQALNTDGLQRATGIVPPVAVAAEAPTAEAPAAKGNAKGAGK